MNTTATQTKPDSTSVDQNQLASTVTGAMHLIDRGLEDISTHEQWQQFLLFQSRFHDYSFHNNILIFLQKPDASYVAGYNTWKQMGRQVRRGERGIRILAPIVTKVRRKESEDALVPVHVSASEEDNHPKPTESEQEVKKIVHGFRMVSVFDLSQTDGDEDTLPIPITGLRTEHPTSRKVYTAMKETLEGLGIPVQEDPHLSSKGAYRISDGSILIKAGTGPDQKLKTLLHELAHHLHHVICLEDETRSDREVIAESCAFVACHHLGVDTGDYSFPYLCNWMNDRGQLKKLAPKIHRISRSMLAILPEL